MINQCKTCKQQIDWNHYYCSPECQADGQRVHEPKLCPSCGDYFYGANMAKRKYCSRECYEKARGPREYRWYECLNCGVLFYEHIIKERKYCGRECLYQHRQPKLEDLELYQWLRTYRKSSRWSKIRQRVKERDDFTCQSCFVSNTTLNVHHIVPLREFWPDRIRDSEKPSNLITLCEHCHPQVEHGNLDCPQPKLGAE